MILRVTDHLAVRLCPSTRRTSSCSATDCALSALSYSASSGRTNTSPPRPPDAVGLATAITLVHGIALFEAAALPQIGTVPKTVLS
jgi:hypothetical protein